MDGVLTVGEFYEMSGGRIPDHLHLEPLCRARHHGPGSKPATTMKRNAHTLALAAIGLGLATPAFATNGDNLIGIGPISRALGGTGIAAPQDAISAVFANPAAMCISPSCASPQADIALTLFMPEVNRR